jgi:ubiquinone/menaquinone biosynthesis C-methylase UbiE
MDTPEPSRRIPGLGPEVYARWRASMLGATSERLERRLILELAGTVSGCDVLDLGRGDGDLALALNRPGARVVGVDASASMIETARARTQGEDAAFLVATAEQLPFRPACFDPFMAVTLLCPSPSGCYRGSELI